MALDNLQTALDNMTDEQIIPTPPAPPPDNTWVPTEANIQAIVALMRTGVNNGWTRQAIREALIKKARDDYSKTLTRRMVDEIWTAWQAEIVERQTPEVVEP